MLGILPGFFAIAVVCQISMMFLMPLAEIGNLERRTTSDRLVVWSLRGLKLWVLHVFPRYSFSLSLSSFQTLTRFYFSVYFDSFRRWMLFQSFYQGFSRLCTRWPGILFKLVVFGSIVSSVRIKHSCYAESFVSVPSLQTKLLWAWINYCQ